jgi:NAD(P)-dependent dehydrogenase (short-subunit alcohol dehydrogenase family)
MNDSPVAVITGASSGIGLETALAFARRGYRIVLAARGADRLADGAARCEAIGAEALAIPTDVAQEDQVRALVEESVERFGRIDVMVNNAGYGVHARVHETTTEQMRRIFETNYFGVFFGCRAVAPIMIRQRRGHIFNVSSVIGKRGAPFNGAYSATKFAVCGLTDAMRVEMMPYDVRVTSVCPVLTETAFFDHVEGGTPRKRSSFVRFRGLMPPSIVGKKIASSVGKSVPELIFSPGGRLLVWITAIWPRLADRMMKLYHDDLAAHP